MEINGLFSCKSNSLSFEWFSTKTPYEPKANSNLEMAYMSLHSPLQDGMAPEETIKFGSEYIVLDTWVRRRQYGALKNALGTGVTLHLQVGIICQSQFFSRFVNNLQIKCVEVVQVFNETFVLRGGEGKMWRFGFIKQNKKIT